MIYTSPIPPVQPPSVGIYQFLFGPRKNEPDNNRPMMIDIITGESLTFGQIRDAALQFAAGLQDKYNFQKQNTVVVFSPNKHDYVVPLFGTLAIGGTVSPANPSYSARELCYQLQQTKPVVLVACPGVVETALKAADAAGLPRDRVYVFGDEVVQNVLPYKHHLSALRKATPTELTPREVETSIAYLCFSSGTTGRSKGVMTSHKNITTNLLQFDAVEGHHFTKKSAKVLGTLPFFHIYGLLTIVHGPLYWGTPVYVMSRFDLKVFCDSLQRYKITYAFIVPPIALALAKDPSIDSYDLSSVEVLVSGAAPMGEDLAQALEKRLPHVIHKQGYGLTETSPILCLQPSDRVFQGSVGVLLPNIKAKIVDDNGQDVKPGQRGEIWVHGPNVMMGYLNNKEATDECIDNEGYFHTGDVAYVNKEGHFFIVDRIKELIKYKGFQVPPAELEAILLKSPLVADCAVIGVYDKEQATEIPRAYVTLKKDIPQTAETASSLMKFVAGQVAHYKKIRSVRFVNDIPKNPSGKILRRLLRDKEKAENLQAKL